MATLAEERLTLLRAIRAQAERVEELVSQSAFDELSQCLEIRQSHIDRILELDRELAQAPGQSVSAEERQCMDEVLRDIVALDERNASRIGAAIDEAQTGLRETNLNRNLVAAYHWQPPDSRFINNRG